MLSENQKLLAKTAGEIAYRDPAFAKHLSSIFQDALLDIAKALDERDRCLDKKDRMTVKLALETLKDAFKKRGMNCQIAGEHPLSILNAIGGLLGENPGFGV